MAEVIKRFQPTPLREFCSALFVQVGVSQKDAWIVADSLVEADLRGIESHGVTRVGIRNSNHFGAAAYYAMRATCDQCIGLAMTNAPPTMAPWGGKTPFFGTNPFAIAIPAGKERAIAHEAMGKEGAMSHHIRPLFHGMKVCGPALTVSCHPGDNLMLHKAISIAEPGDVIVCTVGGHLECGYWGEITTVAAMERGVKGLIIDGSVRDMTAIGILRFPVFSGGVCMKGTYKQTLGTVNHPIICGGVRVKAGDIILGDDDGVVIIPIERAADVYEECVKKERSEAEIIEQLKKGKTTLELLGFERTLQLLGLIES